MINNEVLLIKPGALIFPVIEQPVKGGGIVVGTRGIHYYPNYSILINYYEDVEKLCSTNDSDCYRLIFFEEGIGSAMLNQEKIAVLPFTGLCLNEKDIIYEVNVSDIKLHLLCFHPTAINNRLTLEKVNSDEGLALSDSQDKLFLLPFIIPNRTPLNFHAVHQDTGRRVKDILLILKELLYVQNDSWPCLTRSYLIELLFLVERTYSFYKQDMESVNNCSRLSADEVRRFIHNNYMNKITISDLVKSFHTNRTTLSREFKNSTGFTLVTYLLKIRIEIAAGMLRDTNMNVAVIIERVGFHNITQFNKVFKKYMKCLPTEYRKKFSSN